MEILKYERNKNGLYNVFLSNGEVLTLNEKVITENELLLKKEIDNLMLQKLGSENEIHTLYLQGIKYTTIRLRSIKEMKDYYTKKGVNEENISKIISKLINNNYLDDERFTKAYIKDKMMFTTSGDYKIKKDLINLGIDEEIIRRNIENIDSNLLENKMRKIIEKDIKANKKYNGLKLKNKIYNHLLTQGYNKEKVINVINDYDF